ncbi:hypothetical protein RUE5091_02042 [Ruegeria denitrificans]|uniref:Uncharacterized protein n=1 Tax=Ruegeria denitrificans TaxID=1715692 RepID=A0A0P1IRD6_9RHOB|nr:hypothetical protein [Ruegeria denitrificans]CUJ99444.1 hypothetical protein RUE5091_02042 [Ruegeria denitrificans]
MMDTDILELLDDIGRASVARLNPAVTIPGETAQARREKVLRTIRGTILPRRLEFTAANGDCLAIEVNSSRVTDVFRVQSGIAPDFETEPREDLAIKLAQLVTDIASAPAPLELISLQPDSALEADDVGITFSEIEAACEKIELPAEPVISIVPVDAEPEDNVPVAEGENTDTLAQRFYDGAERFTQGRILATGADGTEINAAEDCAENGAMRPNSDLLARFVRDLAGWNDDSSAAMDHPQLIVMRPSGGKGAGLAILNNGENFAMAVHEARKLGAVVNLWTNLKGPGG